VNRLAVVLKSSREIDKMRVAGKATREVLELLRGLVKPGVTTMDLEKAAAARVAEMGCKPAFLGYSGYPAVLCASVNGEVVHGIPNPKRVLKDGDIVSLDFGVFVDGWCGDSAITVPVGKVDPETERLLKVTEASLHAGIAVVKPGATLGDVGAAVQGVVEAAGFSVVRDFVGHGIGTHMHEDPQVPNYGLAGKGMKLRAGMVIAIEPMVNAGKPDVMVLGDGWTAVTADGSMSAHFEHTVAVTATGARVLTE
jgi:methionyl aminopeptidase